MLLPLFCTCVVGLPKGRWSPCVVFCPCCTVLSVLSFFLKDAGFHGVCVFPAVMTSFLKDANWFHWVCVVPAVLPYFFEGRCPCGVFVILALRSSFFEGRCSCGVCVIFALMLSFFEGRCTCGICGSYIGLMYRLMPMWYCTMHMWYMWELYRAKCRLMPNSALLILWGGFTKIEFASDSRQKKNHHHYSIRSSQQWAFGEWKKFPWLNLANDGRVSKKKLHSGLNL